MATCRKRTYNGKVPVPTYYIETSVWGSLVPRQPADRKRIVRRLLSLLDGHRGRGVIAAVVLAEVNLAPAAEAEGIRRSITSLRPTVYAVTEAVEALAQAYIAAGVLPERLIVLNGRQWTRTPALRSDAPRDNHSAPTLT